MKIPLERKTTLSDFVPYTPWTEQLAGVIPLYCDMEKNYEHRVKHVMKILREYLVSLELSFGLPEMWRHVPSSDFSQIGNKFKHDRYVLSFGPARVLPARYEDDKNFVDPLAYLQKEKVSYHLLIAYAVQQVSRVVFITVMGANPDAYANSASSLRPCLRLLKALNELTAVQFSALVAAGQIPVLHECKTAGELIDLVDEALLAVEAVKTATMN